MMIRQYFGLEKGFGWARTAQFWTLARVCDAGCVPGDMRATLIGLALRTLRAIPARKACASDPKGRSAGLSGGACRQFGFAC